MNDGNKLLVRITIVVLMKKIEGYLRLSNKIVSYMNKLAKQHDLTRSEVIRMGLELDLIKAVGLFELSEGFLSQLVLRIWLSKRDEAPQGEKVLEEDKPQKWATRQLKSVSSESGLTVLLGKTKTNLSS